MALRLISFSSKLAVFRPTIIDNSYRACSMLRFERGIRILEMCICIDLIASQGHIIIANITTLIQPSECAEMYFSIKNISI